MTDRLDTGLDIHSIIIGINPVNGMKWSVGQEVTLGKDRATHTISRITIDDNYFEMYGAESYVVFVKDKDGDEYLWRRYDKMPVSIIYTF